MLLGEVFALSVAALALVAAAVAGGDVLRPLPDLRERHSFFVWELERTSDGKILL